MSHLEVRGNVRPPPSSGDIGLAMTAGQEPHAAYVQGCSISTGSCETPMHEPGGWAGEEDKTEWE